MSEKEKELFLLELKKYFKPEFINRVDEIVVFESLTKEDIDKIVMLMIDDLNERLSMRNMKLTLDPAAVSLIAKNGYSKEYGARQLSRSIQKMIEDELSKMILLVPVRGDRRPHQFNSHTTMLSSNPPSGNRMTGCAPADESSRN